MKRVIREVMLYAAGMMVVPFFLVLLLYGKEGICWEKDPGMEPYLPAQIVKYISTNMNIETMKAQAVLTRSNVTKALREGSLSFFDLKKDLRKAETQMDNKAYWELYQRSLKAAQETQMQVLTYEGEVQYAPFHQVSAGRTRDGWEITRKPEYAVCRSVKSESDCKEKEYEHFYLFSREELVAVLNAEWLGAGVSEETLAADLHITKRDSADYIMQISVGSMLVGGEEFRVRMGFASSCFSIEICGDQIRFVCRGMGHGLGMSQFGAQVMAEQGRDYTEILHCYFPKMQLS